MANEFVGTGWRFPIGPEPPAGDVISMISEEELISQSIDIILRTSKGERVMRPDFGCGIYDLVFAINDNATASRVAYEVRQALINWEPRIDVLDVRAAPKANEANTLLIQIEYRVRTTNNVFNIVYPFYLESGAR